MNDEIQMLERAKTSTWPAGPFDGTKIRRRAKRRQQRRVALTAAATVVGAVALGGLFNLVPNSSQTVVDPSSACEGLTISGITFTLPSDWETLQRPSVNKFCVGPAGTTDACPVTIAVAADPQAAPDEGLDVIPDLMSVCDKNDARLVRVVDTSTTVAASSAYSGRCNSGDDVMSAWAVDNRIAYVLTRDPRRVADANSIFNSIDIPSDFQDPSDPTTTTPASG